MKKFSMWNIAVQNVVKSRFRSIAMVCFVTLLAASLFVNSILVMNVNYSIDRARQRMGADIIVIPKGYEKELQGAMFTGQPSTIYFDKNWTEKLLSIEGVRRASPQLYLATMTDSACCIGGNQLIVFDEKSDFIIKPWLSSLEMESLKLGEVIVGDKIFLAEGEKVKFFDYELTIKSKMEATNMTYDSGVFMNFETAQELLKEEAAKKNLHIKDSDELISMVTIDIEDRYDVDYVKRQMQYNFVGEGIEVVTASSLISNSANNLSSLQAYGGIIIVLLFAVTVLAMMVIFGLTVNERRREFGVLYIMGLKSSQLFSLVLMEAGFISFIGGVAGSMGAWFIMSLFHNLITTKFALSSLEILNINTAIVGIACVVVSVFAGIVAAFYGALSVGREEPYNLIKEN